MNDMNKLTAIIESGVQSPALAFGLSAVVFAHDDTCPKMAGGDCACDPDIYDGLTNEKIEAARPAPVSETPEPLEILRAAGWRALDDLNFARGGELLHYTGSLGIGGWWILCPSPNVNRWARLGETLADAVDALGLGEPQMIVEAVR